jgi:hypothetical protein
MFASYSSNYGATWTTPPGINVSDGIYASSGPNDIATSSDAANGNHMFLVWGDNQTGISQVIFSESNPNFTVTTTTIAATNATTAYTVLPTTSSRGATTTSRTSAHSASASATVSFPPPPATTVSSFNPGSLSVPALDYYILAIAVVIVAAAASAIYVVTRKPRPPE